MTPFTKAWALLPGRVQQAVHNLIIHPLVEGLTIISGDGSHWEWLHHEFAPVEYHEESATPECVEAAINVLLEVTPKPCGQYLVSRSKGVVVWIERLET